MKKKEFREWELTEKAFEIYSNSSYTFYEKDGVFFMGFNLKDTPFEVGNINDVVEFLENN